MSKSTIGIIVGSSRPDGNSTGIASWVVHELKKFNPRNEVKIFTPISPMNLLAVPINTVSPKHIKDGSYEDPVIRKWSKEVSGLDAIVFVTPVYNHSYTGQLKIMLDHLYNEFANKPVILVSQGPHAPKLALEHLNPLVTKFTAKVVGELAMKIPSEYAHSPKRVQPEFDGTYENDPFLKDSEVQLQEAIKKLALN